MTRANNRLGGRIVNAMFALATFFFVFAPTMDALAKEDALEARPSVAERVLAAFDVVDDVLDHLPGHVPAAQQHHVQLAQTPQAVAERAVALTEDTLTWALASDAPKPTADSEPPGHPPRG